MKKEDKTKSIENLLIKANEEIFGKSGDMSKVLNSAIEHATGVTNDKTIMKAVMVGATVISKAVLTGVENGVSQEQMVAVVSRVVSELLILQRSVK